MALENRLDLRLSQKLILTPQLQQAIKLLQLPQLELASVLNQELAENPFLEEVAEEPETTSESAAGHEDEPQYSDSYDEGELSVENLTKFSVDDYFEERSSDGRDLGYFSAGLEDRPSYELFYSQKPDLYSHLLWQLRLCSAADDIRRTAEVVIGNLDEDGYLRATEDELMNASGVSAEAIQAAVALVQGFDPPGIAARDLKECLLLQVKALVLCGSLVEKIVANNLDDLQKHKYGQIARAYGLSLDEVMNAVRIIEGLDPRPATSLSGGETSYVAPDVSIVRTDEGYQIVLNDEGMPRLGLNSAYRQLLQNKENLTREERSFMREKLRLAVELIKSLDQRNRTIYKVSESILKFQQEFFDRGREYLKPLNLKDVAQDINMHESTISRVTSNKFLSCEHGVFSFRFFFSSALQSGNGEDVSSTSVKDLIRKIVAAENSVKPMSDKLIADKLGEHSIKIARRTVAKYREELKIPPQNMRKKYD
ncbi:MAG TPA: RNA polymerase factor sigma-54 [Dissulfurispiraceae bacterium]|nr:RNA polymerase factor sigma-54 [Dissulfurispiraceae bacterium]